MVLAGREMSTSFLDSKKKINLKHNRREEEKPKENIDLDRAHYNNHIIAKNPREEYEKVFGEARKEYNENQKVYSRRIDDYYSKVNGYKNREVYSEAIFGLGRMEDWEDATAEEWEEGLKVVNDFANKFIESNDKFHILSADVHGDEATPHAHIVYIPIGEGYKQGMQKQTSKNKALEGMGYSKQSDFQDWRDANLENFTEIAEDYGIERKIVGNRGYDSVEHYVEAKEELDEANDLLSDQFEIWKENNELLDKKIKEEEEKKREVLRIKDEVEEEKRQVQREQDDLNVQKQTLKSEQAEYKILRSGLDKDKDSVSGVAERIRIVSNVLPVSEKVALGFDRYLKQGKTGLRQSGKVVEIDDLGAVATKQISQKGKRNVDETVREALIESESMYEKIKNTPNRSYSDNDEGLDGP